MANDNNDNTVRDDIVYKGRKVTPFVSEVPVTFGPEGKNMVVAFREGSTNIWVGSRAYSRNPDDCPRIQTVMAYVPGRKYPVITTDASYEFCGEVPEIQKTNNLLKGFSLLARGKVTALTTGQSSFDETLDMLCDTSVLVSSFGHTVRFVTKDAPLETVRARCDRFSTGKYKARLALASAPLTIHSLVDVKLTVAQLGEFIISQTDIPDLLVIDRANLIKPNDEQPLLNDLVQLAETYNMAILTTNDIG